MTKLNEHFTAMQAMASRYLEPTPYIDHRGVSSESNKTQPGWDERHVRDNLFAGDMVYMLDGPEQREAQASQAADLEAEAAEWRADLRTQVAQADAIATSAREHAKGMEKRNAELERENNDLRTRLYNSELAYAKLHGYLEGRQDAEPPRMVPEQREPLMARMPDASGVSTGWRNDASHWFHRG